MGTYALNLKQLWQSLQDGLESISKSIIEEVGHAQPGNIYILALAL